MIQFIVGIVLGAVLTIFCIAVWAVFEEEREDDDCDLNDHDDEQPFKYLRKKG